MNDILADIKHHEDDFIHLIRDRLGIIIHHHQKNDLTRILSEACKTFHYTPTEYLKMLYNASDSSPIIEHLITGITIGETYFFRDSNQINLLQEMILPTLIKRKREQKKPTLRIWSAGSASGEEIYTIAMLLCDILPDIKAWTLTLLGTDINTQSLKKAINGIYSEWSMRSTSERYKQRYFTLNNNGQYIISQNIRDMVTFEYLNLNEDSFPSILNATNAQDFILCRNVLIYFDRDRGIKLMQKLSDSLVDGGFLLLGASDPVYTSETNLIFNYKQGALFTRPTLTESHKIEKVLNPVHKETIHKETLPKIRQKTVTPKLHTEKKPSETSLTLTQEEQQKQINQLLSEARWQETLDTIKSYRHHIIKSAFLLSAEATALANLGKLDQAVQRCHDCLAIDSTNINTYFTLAMVLVELNRTKEAEAAFRKTLFLDHEFVMGHFQLGLLLIKNKQHELGLKCLSNALAIVKSHSPEDEVKGFNKLCYGHFAEILQHEIDLHAISKGKKL